MEEEEQEKEEEKGNVLRNECPNSGVSLPGAAHSPYASESLSSPTSGGVGRSEAHLLAVQNSISAPQQQRQEQPVSGGGRRLLPYTGRREAGGGRGGTCCRTEEKSKDETCEGAHGQRVKACKDRRETGRGGGNPSADKISDDLCRRRRYART